MLSMLGGIQRSVGQNPFSGCTCIEAFRPPTYYMMNLQGQQRHLCVTVKQDGKHCSSTCTGEDGLAWQ